METKRYRASPPGWADDALSAHIDTIWLNNHATFHHKAVYTRLKEIDAAMMRGLVGWSGVSPEFEVYPPIALFYRAHSSFRCLCMLAMGGAVTEATALLRLALEQVGYAVMIKEKPPLARVWFDRDASLETEKIVRKTFSTRAMKEAIGRLSPENGPIFEKLYEQSIKIGAHPNEKSITLNIKLETVEDGQQIQQIYLHDNSTALNYLLKYSAQTGVMILKLFCCLFPERSEEVKLQGEVFLLSQGL